MGDVTPGKFVRIATGEVYEGYTDGNQVATELTKKDTIPGNRSWPHLASWFGRLHATLIRGQVARYDVKTEWVATPIRAEIAELHRDLARLEEKLKETYDYQAGPNPAEEVNI